MSTRARRPSRPGLDGRHLRHLHAGHQWRLDLHRAEQQSGCPGARCRPDLTETFTVRSNGWHHSTVVVTINGTNDAAVISAGTGSVTEDVGVVGGNISTGGTLT
jgi:VCBS repeat-containing protein